MTRFAENAEKLEQDGAMEDYRRRAAKDPDGFDPAEWIAALHQEHWRTLELLKESEGERVARILAGLQLVLREVRRAESDLGMTRTTLGDVLGDTLTVQRLREIGRDLRRSVVSSLEEIIQEGR